MDPLRHRIIVEATRQFVERGFDGTSMREIADACGVTKAALYYHYPGKADLLLDILGAYLDAMAQAVAVGRASDPSPAAQLRAVIAGLFGFPPEGRAVIRLALHDLRHLPEADRSGFGASYHERFLNPLADIVRDGIAAGEFPAHDPMTIVWIILGMLYPFLSRRPAEGTEQQTMAELLDVLLNGLRRR